MHEDPRTPPFAREWLHQLTMERSGGAEQTERVQELLGDLVSSAGFGAVYFGAL